VQLSFHEEQNRARYQFWTPEWAAIELVDRFFPDLKPTDLVLEPSCGLGAFLKAIPADVPAIGVEIDPFVSEQCRENTGRRVITGDFISIALPEGITVAVGNPPFSVPLIQSFLHRLVNLPELQRCGLLLPAYALQTHNTVERWRSNWSLRAELIPRRLFPRLRLPLLFVKFIRDQRRDMIGFALYDQAVDIDKMPSRYKEVLTFGRPRQGAWRALVTEVLGELGEADLGAIYAAIEPRRPTPNAWWREKVRQVLQLHFIRVGNGRWKAQDCCTS